MLFGPDAAKQEVQWEVFAGGDLGGRGLHGGGRRPGADRRSRDSGRAGRSRAPQLHAALHQTSRVRRPPPTGHPNWYGCMQTVHKTNATDESCMGTDTERMGPVLPSPDLAPLQLAQTSKVRTTPVHVSFWPR